jgi:hypothetical protein
MASGAIMSALGENSSAGFTGILVVTFLNAAGFFILQVFPFIYHIVLHYRVLMDKFYLEGIVIDVTKIPFLTITANGKLKGMEEKYPGLNTLALIC